MSSLGNRYASALLSIAIDENKNAEYRDFIKSIYKETSLDDSFSNLLSCPNIDKDNKKEIIDKVLKDCPFEYIKNLFKVIIDNNRGEYINEVMKEFISISNLHDGICEGFIYTPEKMEEEAIDRISNAISKRIKKKVYLVQKLDETLIGGFKVVINDYVFDASLKNKQKLLKQQLLEGR